MCGIWQKEAVYGPCQSGLLCFACILFQYSPEPQQISLPAPKLSSDFQLFSLWLVFLVTVLALRLLPLHTPGLLVQQTQRLTAQIPSKVHNDLV